MPEKLELTAVVLSLIYLILLIQRNIWCWLAGFISSALSIKVMYDYELRIEPWLYVFYTLVAVYGFIHWKNEDSENLDYSIIELSLTQHIVWICSGIAFTFLFGWLFDVYSEGESTYLDAFTTGFAIIATVLQTRKVKSNFIYWIIINAATVYLYFSRNMEFYPWLMIVYLVMSFYGFFKWNELDYSSKRE